MRNPLVKSCVIQVFNIGHSPKCRIIFHQAELDYLSSHSALIPAAFPPLFLSAYTIHPASTTLAAVPAKVASSAPVRVNLVLVTLAARKYTLIV